MIYDISYQPSINPKPMRIIFDKVDELIGVYDRNRYFILFEDGKYDSIYNRIRYLIGVKT